jgi:hypothetical protein
MSYKGFSVDFVKEHVGFEVKALAYAAMEFPRVEGTPREAALQDSAFVHARTLIDFTYGSKPNWDNAYLRGCCDDPGLVAARSGEIAEWFEFLSARIMHVGLDRGEVRPLDQLCPGGWTADRHERLARLVIRSLKHEARHARGRYRDVIGLMTTRAMAYLDDPTDDHRNDMDPSRL